MTTQEQKKRSTGLFALGVLVGLGFMAINAILNPSLSLNTSTVLARESDEDRYADCLIKQAEIGLHRDIGKNITAKDATDKALHYAEQRCGKHNLALGADDAVYWSTRGKARTWFEDPEQ